MKGRAGRGACGRGAARPVGASLTAHGVYARWLARVAASPLPLRSHAQPLSQHTHLWVQGAVVGLQQHLMKPGFDRVGLACKHTPRGGGGRAAGRSGEGASEVAACDKDALQRLVPCPPRHPTPPSSPPGPTRQQRGVCHRECARHAINAATPGGRGRAGGGAVKVSRGKGAATADAGTCARGRPLAPPRSSSKKAGPCSTARTGTGVRGNCNLWAAHTRR